MHSFGRIKQREDRICRRNLGAVVQVGVDIAGGGDVAVAKPLLNVFQGNAVGIEQAGTGMPQIVEADFLHPIALQNQREMLGQEARRDELSHLVDVDVVQVALVIALAAEPPVLRLLCLFPKQGILKGLYQRKRSVAGFRLSAILLDDDALAVQRGLRDRVLDGDRLLLGVYLNKKLLHDIVKYTRYSVLFKYTTTTYSSAFNIVSYLQATFSRFKRQISDKF